MRVSGPDVNKAALTEAVRHSTAAHSRVNIGPTALGVVGRELPVTGPRTPEGRSGRPTVTRGRSPLSGPRRGRRAGRRLLRFRARDRVTPVNRLGELDRPIMDVLWDSTEPLTARQVGLRLTNRDLAHTTVMTVLARLAKKGFARRERDGRAWRYQAAANREAYVTELMLHALDQTGDRSAALASFARRVSDSEAEELRRALESIGELHRD